MLGERVQAREAGIHPVLEDEVAILLGDADRDERRPGEAAVERVVVARDGLLGGVDLAVHDERVVRPQQRAQLPRFRERVEGAQRVAEQQDEAGGGFWGGGARRPTLRARAKRPSIPRARSSPPPPPPTP